MSDVIYGSLPTPNDIKGTVATEEKMSGYLATVFAKDGKSAYEVAVKNGFEGTEAEWLESLKGEQGEQGIQGEKGDKGDTGTQGIQGEKGAKGDKGDAFTYSDFTPEQLASLKGEKGDKGDKGEKGDDGLKGDKGDKGDKGEQGIQGIQGIQGEKGDTGNPGIYLGSGDMPDDCNVQIDPNGDVFTIVQETGNSETAVMSQKAVTDALGKTVPNAADKRYVNETFANTLKGHKSGTAISADDVSPIEHELGIKVSSKNLWDPSKHNHRIYGGVRIVTDYIKVKKNTDYIITVDGSETPRWSAKGFTEDQIQDNSTLFIWQNGTRLRGYYNGSYTDVVTHFNSGDYEYVAMRMWGEFDTYGITPESNYQLEEGMSPTPFTPYVVELEGTEITVSDGENSQGAMVDAEGNVTGLKSYSPTMSLSTDKEGVMIECTYNRDANKVITELETKLNTLVASIGG